MSMTERPTTQPAKKQQQDAGPPAGLETIAAVYRQTETLLSELDKERARADHFEHLYVSEHTENDLLRREVRRLGGRADHFFRAFTSLSSQLQSIGAGILGAVESAKSHSYGMKSGNSHVLQDTQQGEDDGKPIPSFLHEGPRQEITAPIDTAALEEALKRARPRAR